MSNRLSSFVVWVLHEAKTEKEHDVRYMMMVKGDPAANEMPTTEMLAAMGAYNEELVTAGVLLAEANQRG